MQWPDDWAKHYTHKFDIGVCQFSYGSASVHSSGVEQNGNALETVRDGIRIIERNCPDPCAEAVGQCLQATPALFPARKDEVQSGRRGMFCCHATGIAGGSIDHQCVHGDASFDYSRSASMRVISPSSLIEISRRPISWPKSPVKSTRRRARVSPVVSIERKRVTV